MELGWEGPLVVDGTEHALDDDRRIDSPFAQVPFDSPLYEISHGGHELRLDFDTDERFVSAPDDPSADGRRKLERLWLLLRDFWKR